MPIWGVDSVSPANMRSSWEPGRNPELLFDFVTRKLGEPPRFWGRYLRRSGASMLTADERDYIHRQRVDGQAVRILPIYNDWNQTWLNDRAERRRRLRELAEQPDTAYGYGRDDCRSALEIADGLRVRDGVRIYYDLEGWDFPPAWLRGWWDTMRESRYAGIGGLYGRGVERARGAARAVQIRDVDPVQASRPMPHVPGGPPRYSRSGWSAIVPEALNQQFEPWVMEPLASRATDFAFPDVCVWSNTPRTNCRDGPRIEPQFRGLGPAESHVLVWQYQFACFERPLREGEDPDILRPAAFDMDLATQTGFGDMWAP